MIPVGCVRRSRIARRTPPLIPGALSKYRGETPSRSRRPTTSTPPVPRRTPHATQARCARRGTTPATMSVAAEAGRNADLMVSDGMRTGFAGRRKCSRQKESGVTAILLLMYRWDASGAHALNAGRRPLHPAHLPRATAKHNGTHNREERVCRQHRDEHGAKSKTSAHG